MDAAARLMLTYLLHSTLLLGAAWVACRALGERRLALQEAILRAALLGGFVTAGLQVGLGLTPLGGALHLPELAREAEAAPTVPAIGSRSPAPGTSEPAASARASRRGGTSLGRTPASSAAASAGEWPTRIVIVPAGPTWAEQPALAVRSVAAGYWRLALALAWTGLAVAALGRLGVAARRLGRLLCDRTPLASPPLAPAAEAVGGALGLRRPVRISTAPRLSVPLATGVLHPEVCLPARAVSDLGPDEQVALCAHELAHVARRDPAWVLAARVVESLAPLQPLNTWARRRLQDLAECLSDDLAVSVSARSLGLARSLVDVASWTLDDPALLPAAAAGALSARSRLGLRVERLMDPVRRLERPRRALLPTAAVAVVATALVTPVVSGAARAPQAPPAPAAAPAPAPQPAPAARPVPAPRPAPATPPTPEAAPAPEAAPRGDAAARDAAARLDALTRRIEERSHLHEAEMKQLEAEVEAAASRIQPNQAEMRRLSAEIEKAAREMAEASLARAQAAGHGAQASSQASLEAARRMAELQAELRRNAAAIRVPTEEVRALSEKARALAEQVRPTEEERAEIRRLSERLARESMPDADELARLAREQADRARSQSRDVARQTRAAMRLATEEMRRAMDEVRRALEETRRALEETHHGSETRKPAQPTPAPDPPRP